MHKYMKPIFIYHNNRALLETGDILIFTPKKFKLTDPATWLSQGIKHFMEEYIEAYKIKYKEFLSENNLPYLIPTHTAHVIIEDGKVYISEALAKGTVFHKLEEEYNTQEQLERIIVLQPKVELSNAEKIELAFIAKSNAGKKYQKNNFIFHIAKIFAKKLFGLKNLWLEPQPWKMQEKVSCSEHTSREVNYFRPGTFANHEQTNPLEVFVNIDYNVVGFYDAYDWEI